MLSTRGQEEKRNPEVFSENLLLEVIRNALLAVQGSLFCSWPYNMIISLSQKEAFLQQIQAVSGDITTAHSLFIIILLQNGTCGIYFYCMRMLILVHFCLTEIFMKNQIKRFALQNHYNGRYQKVLFEPCGRIPHISLTSDLKHSTHISYYTYFTYK